MYTIYCIEDINDLKYVGSTKLKLNKRLNKHRCDKNKNHYYSSSKLDLDNCKIYSLETDVSKKDKKERERYWINHIDCVNEIKFNYDNQEFCKKYYQENKENLKQKSKENYLFRSKKVVDGCYEFIKMLEEY